jgi:hypothetical protein
VEEKKKTEKERREEGEKRVAGTTCTVPLGTDIQVATKLPNCIIL